ncbi:MAG TPA: GNAT family N-acetyltransferase [Drouetiella sp.]
MEISATDFTIRLAVVSDAAAIVAVHQSAVHKSAEDFYEREVLSDWSSLDPERVKSLERQLSENPDGTTMLVAMRGEQVFGFGEISPRTNEIRAVYVSPTASRSGVGSALLQALIKIAEVNKLAYLWLDSSLNAEPFYSAHGFISQGKADHELKSGRRMQCVKMQKTL